MLEPPNFSLWKGRGDAPRFHQKVRPLPKELREQEQAACCLVGFACDEGVRRNKGRVGAALGPDALRSCLAGLPYHRQLPLTLYDAGTVLCQKGEMEEAQEALAAITSQLIEHGITPLVIGGGHELAYGHYRGIRSALGPINLGIVNLDAHYDLRPLEEGKGHSGSSFSQIAEECAASGEGFHYYCMGIERYANSDPLFERAEKLGVKTLFNDQMEGAEGFLDEVIDTHDALYFSLCLDVIASPFAPGVSAPQPLGLFPRVVLPLIRQAALSQKLAGFDIAELSPPLDPEGNSARLAALLAAEFIHHIHHLR